MYLAAWRDDGPTKIGISSEPVRRLCELRASERLPLLTLRWRQHIGPHAYRAETILKRKMRAARIASEWFQAPPEEVVRYVAGFFALVGQSPGLNILEWGEERYKPLPRPESPLQSFGWHKSRQDHAAAIQVIDHILRGEPFA